MVGYPEGERHSDQNRKTNFSDQKPDVDKCAGNCRPTTDSSFAETAYKVRGKCNKKYQSF